MEKIKNPRTKKMIQVDGKVFQELIDKYHYTRQQLLSPDLSIVTQSLPNDIYKTILLHGTIDQIILFCQTNQYMHDYCQSESFWIDYFNYHQLPIYEYPVNSNGWIKLYLRMKNISDYLDEIIDYIMDGVKFELRVKNKEYWMKKFFPNVNIGRYNITFTKGNDITAKLDNEIVQLTILQFKTIMINLFYHENNASLLNYSNKKIKERPGNYMPSPKTKMMTRSRV